MSNAAINSLVQQVMVAPIKKTRRAYLPASIPGPIRGSVSIYRLIPNHLPNPQIGPRVRRFVVIHLHSSKRQSQKSTGAGIMFLSHDVISRQQLRVQLALHGDHQRTYPVQPSPSVKHSHQRHIISVPGSPIKKDRWRKEKLAMTYSRMQLPAYYHRRWRA